MSNWFGDLDLAYKYIVVFLSLLGLTIIAGFIKVFYNRRRLAKDSKTELEAGPKEDQVELNQREKDEGDLFGIRAIEAGFFAGVAQSRPTSRAGSISSNHPAMSNSTLVGGSVNSPLMKGHSNNNSVLSLNLNATKEPTLRASPPSLRLAPSEAELNGRRNHNGAVDMSLHVPSSPGQPRGPSAPFGGSDDGSEGLESPRSMSPQAGQHSQQYASVPTVSYHAGDENAVKSQAASYKSRGQSPSPPLPYHPPTAKLPTIPGTALRKESRSPSPENDYPRVQVHEPNHEPAQSSLPVSPLRLQPRTYSPQHQRNGSDTSIYSIGDRSSPFQTHQAYQMDADKQEMEKQTGGGRPVSVGTEEMGPSSMFGSMQGGEGERRRSQSNHHLAPGQGGKDTRLSEFYEAYYRNSHLGSMPGVESSQQQVVDRQSTIMEVETPVASPMSPKHAGVAL